jgi:hypothetical protein
MKNRNYFIIGIVLALFVVMSSCKKESSPAGTDQNAPTGTVSTITGLGPNAGPPSGTSFTLPQNIKIIGSIRGGMPYGKIINKDYTGPFPYTNNPKSWVDYGSGTFVNLYIKFYNTSTTPYNLALPGGLIFCDSLDAHGFGTYQKGLILQDVNIPVPALDTAFACIRAYCLNHTLQASSYAAVYYIGPITNNQDLNQIVAIMDTKQYPVGNEYDIQNIVWNVTDYGLTLTAAEITYLNSLP